MQACHSASSSSNMLNAGVHKSQERVVRHRSFPSVAPPDDVLAVKTPSLAKRFQLRLSLRGSNLYGQKAANGIRMADVAALRGLR
jgi:hypothetical protein